MALPGQVASGHSPRNRSDFSMDSIPGEVIDYGKALDVKQVAWAKKQLWAPDAAEKNGTYYLYFPAKDSENIFEFIR